MVAQARAGRVQGRSNHGQAVAAQVRCVRRNPAALPSLSTMYSIFAGSGLRQWQPAHRAHLPFIDPSDEPGAGLQPPPGSSRHGSEGWRNQGGTDTPTWRPGCRICGRACDGWVNHTGPVGAVAGRCCRIGRAGSAPSGVESLASRQGYLSGYRSACRCRARNQGERRHLLQQRDHRPAKIAPWKTRAGHASWPRWAWPWPARSVGHRAGCATTTSRDFQ